MAALIKRRRIETLAFKYQSIAANQSSIFCLVYQLHSHLLTASQTCKFAQVKPQSIYRWLIYGKVDSMKTAGDGHHICLNSLFRPGPAPCSQGELPAYPLFLHSD